MEKNYYMWFLIFLSYSFLGWMMEVISKSYSYKKLVNRGFLFGPICPIYGFGAIFITIFLTEFRNYPVVVFLLGCILTGTIEYFTSYILEKIFNNKWWDYSTKKYNINGRVRLDFIALFGLFSCVVIYLGNDFFINLFSMMNYNSMKIISIILLFLFIVDIIYSNIIAYNLRNRTIIAEELKANKLAMIPGYIEKVLKGRVENLKLYPTRLLDAFPYIKSRNEDIFNKMKKIRTKIKTKKSKSSKNK